MRVGQFWAGSDLTHYELSSLLSFAASGVAVTLFTYEESNATPREIGVVPAEEVLPITALFANNGGKSFAAFANLFRYRMLRQFDLIWTDSDVVAGPMAFPDSSYLFGWESERVINNAILRIPKEDLVLQELEFRALSRAKEEYAWGALGPRLLTEVIHEFGLENLAQDKSVFYPVSYSEPWDLFDPKKLEEVSEVTSQSSGIHLWNETLRRSLPGFKSYWPPKGSYLDCVFSDLGLKPGPKDSRLSLSKIRLIYRPRVWGLLPKLP